MHNIDYIYKSNSIFIFHFNLNNNKVENLKFENYNNEILEYGQEEIKRNIENILSINNVKNQFKLKKELIKNGSCEFEFLIKRKNSSKLAFLKINLILADKNDKLFYGFANDISRYKKLEYQFNELQKISKQGIWELDLQENKLYWSNEVYEIFGIKTEEKEYSFKEFNIDYFFNYVHPDDVKYVQDKYYKSIEEKKVYDLIHRIIDQKGNIKYLRELCKTFYDQSDEPLNSIGLTIDVTEQINENINTQNISNKYKCIFENSPIGIIQIDLKGYILKCNKSFLRMIGYELNEVIDKSIDDFTSDKINISEIIEKHSADVFNKYLYILTKENEKIKAEFKLNIAKDIIKKSNTIDIFVNSLKLKEEYEFNQKLYYSVINNSNDLVIIINNKNEIIFTNSKTSTLLNINEFSQEKLKIEDFVDFNINFTDDLLISKLVDNTITKIKLRNYKKNIEFDINTVLISNDEDIEEFYVAIIGRDLTEYNNLNLLIKENYDSFKNIFNSSPVPLIIVEIDSSEVIMANKMAIEFFDNESQKIIGYKTIDCYLDKNDRYKYIKEIDKNGQVDYFETELIINNKKYFVSLSGSYIILHNKKYILTSIYDLTDIKKYQNKLQYNELRFKTFLNSTPDSMIVVNRDQNIILANDIAYKMFKYEKDELTEKHISSLIPIRYRMDHKMLVSNYFKDPHFREMGVGSELFALRKDGTEFPVEISLSFFNFEDEMVSIASIRDISNKKYVDKKLLEQSILIENANDAMIVTDYEGKILLWNKGAEKTFNKDSNVISKLLFDIFDVSILKQLKKAFNKCIELGSSNVEIKYKDKNLESKKTIEFSFSSLYDEINNINRVFIHCKDITEKKHFESKQIQNQRIDNIGVLSSGIAHDMNNILTPIIMSIDSLKSMNKDSKQEKFLSIIEEGINRASDLVSQILSFSKNTTDETVPLNLRQLLINVQKMLIQTLPKTIKLIFNISKEHLYIQGNETQIKQILINLIINSSHAMDGKGEIIVNLSKPTLEDLKNEIEDYSKEMLKIEVKDHGIGMDKTTIEKIFLPFYTTKSKDKGTGLGLALVNKIVEEHNGVIKVNSRPKIGTSFFVYFPIIENTNYNIGKDVDNITYDFNGEKILVIDDDKPIREFMEIVLGRRDLKVNVQSSVSDGLEEFFKSKDKYDLIITDFELKDGTGEFIINTIKGVKKNAKFICMSGNYEELERISEKYQINTMKKPFNLNVLVDTVYKTLYLS